MRRGNMTTFAIMKGCTVGDEISHRDRIPRRLRAAMLFVLVLTLLNLVFRLPALFEEQGRLGRLFSPSLDAVLLAAAVCVYTWLRLPGFDVFAALLAAVGLAALSFLTADSLIPLFFNRPFEMATDLTYIPDLYALLRDTASGRLFYGGLAIAVLVVGAAGCGLFFGFRVLRRGFQQQTCRYGFLLLVAVLVVLDLLSSFRFLPNTAGVRLAEELTEVAHRNVYLQEQQQVFAEQVRHSQRSGRPLDGLAGRNVYLFIVESYGYTLYSEPAHFEPVQAGLRELETELSQAGFGMCSGFLTSPAFGGNSWLADSTLASGVLIDNEAAYDVLLRSDVKPMARSFNEAGYRTVLAMPALTSPWPEGEFFGFTAKYYFKDYGYRGPSLKWAPMTDQYALYHIYKREVLGAGQPLFIEFVMISSHYPFNLVPSFFENWSQLGDGSIYHREGSVTVLPTKPGTQTGGAEGYTAVIAYDLKLIGEFLKSFVHDEALIVVIGDHQPYSGITGKNKLRSVPVHILSRRPDFLAPFLKRGYTRGFIPSRKPPHDGMETFWPAFLEDFSFGVPGQPAPQASGSG